MPVQDNAAAPAIAVAAAVSSIAPTVARFKLPVLRVDRHVPIGTCTRSRILRRDRVLVDAPQPNKLVVACARDGPSIRGEDDVVDPFAPDGPAVRVRLLAWPDELGWRRRYRECSKEGGRRVGPGRPAGLIRRRT